MAEIARFDNVSYRYPETERPALDGVSITFRPAETVLLLGPSGSGKSTILAALAGLAPHFYGGTLHGHVHVAGNDTRDARPRELSRHVGMVFQDPESQAVMTTVEREIAFGLENAGLPTATITRLVEESLISLGLSYLRRAPLASLSGGELQKVALAAVLALQPEILLLDEPTSQLDPVSAEELLSAVRRLSDDTGATILLAEHRVDRCLHLASRVLYMENGAVLLDAVPEEFCRWALANRPEFVPPVTRLMAPYMNGHVPITVKQARRLLLDLPDSAFAKSVAPSDSPAPAPSDAPANRPGAAAVAPAPGDGSAACAPGDVLLEVRNLRCGYDPEYPVLDGVDLTLRAGEFVVLMGENGSGKSTLVRHLNGLATPFSGSVTLCEHDVGALSVAQAARVCAVLGQNPTDYFVCDTLAEEIEYSLQCLAIPEDERAELRRRTVCALDVEELLERNPRDLSGGERTRAALATVLAAEPRLIILDEPTRGLDPQAKASLGDTLARLVDQDRAVLVVTHDVEFAARYAHRIVLLGDAGVLADGPAAQTLDGSLFFSTQVNRLFRHVRPGIMHEDQIARSQVDR